MTDRRGQASPTPTPPPDDLSGFYGGAATIGAVPIMRGPDDMPDPPPPTFMEGMAASFRSGLDDQEIPLADRVARARTSIVDRLKGLGYDPNRFYSTHASNPYLAAGGMGAAPSTVTDLDDGKIWEAVLREKRRGHLADIPDTAEDYYRQARNRFGRADQDSATAGRAGLVPQLLGGIGSGFADPINIMSLPLGGGGKTIASRILSEALVNSGVELLEQPLVADARAKRGKKFTLGEAAANVATAGVAGGLFQGVLAEPAGALLKRFLKAVPSDQMTDAERGAVSILQRADEVDASSPFVPGADTEAHLARLDEAMRSVSESLPGAAPPTARTNLRSGTSLGSGIVTGESARVRVEIASPAARQQFKSRVHHAEAGGGDDFNEASGAMGPYQFLASTWNRYYIRRYGRGGLTDAQIAAKRRDPQLNEVLMDDMTADNAAHLRRIGVRETAGNLYLEHFAGQGGAEAIFRAAPDTPIERLLSRRAVEANPFLRGKTAKDVIDWAHRRMGEAAGDAPTLRREQFPEGETGDAEWQTAQHESDLAEMELRRSRQERFMRDAYTAEPGERQVLRAEMNAESTLSMLEDVPAFVARSVPDFESGYLADAGARQASRAEMAQPSIDPEVQAIPGEYGRQVDTEPARTEAPVPSRQQYVIERATPVNRPRTEPMDTSLRTVFVSNRGAERLGAREGAAGTTIELDEPSGTILLQSDRGLEAIPFMTQAPKGGKAMAIQIRKAKIRALPGRAWSAALDHGSAAAKRAAPAAEPVATGSSESGLKQAIGAQFSNPVGPAALAVAEGLTHDLNRSLETGELGDIAFAADGIETAHGGVEPRYRTAKQVLAELDADDAAIAALRNCL